MRSWVRAALVVAAFRSAIALAAAQKPADLPLDVLLDRAGWYLDSFIEEFENVVAEEQYRQDASANLPSFSPVTGGRGGVGVQTPASELVRARHRALRSDFLLVRSPDTDALVPFRDVMEVDGVQVRDREARLAKLFLNAAGASVADTMARAERIREEGARYNLGSMRSTLGNPVLALGVLQKSYQPRFRFALAKPDRDTGPGMSVVTYKEVASPAMIRGEGGLDLPAFGRLWIDTASGRVLKTQLQVQQAAISAIVTTTFELDERTGIAVPHEMREQYTQANGNRVHMVATYGHFRRFDVSAEEEIRTPSPSLVEPWTGITLVEVPAGRFTMGSPLSEPGRNDDETLHDVELTRSFLLGRFEVTQQEWRTVIGTAPSTFAACGSRCPVENVSFEDVQQFLMKLNARTTIAPAPAPRLRFRLPSEAEWEYACRAQTTGPFSTGENLTTGQANYNGTFPYPPAGPSKAGEARQKPAPAGSFPFNPWGLADIHGNVWEWTADWYGPYADAGAANIDPHGAAAGDERVIRGGSWAFDANSARCGLRYTHAPKDRGHSLGFRVAADRLPN
jgi:formylglycine-generating enzyme required for sulfatase activity